MRNNVIDYLKSNCSSFSLIAGGMDEGGFAAHLTHNMNAIVSWGEGWDHVSVSHRARVPIWEEMCWVKDLFWTPEECVVQYHPPKVDYINCHPNCLHLWKPQGIELPRPPSYMVGPRPGETVSESVARWKKTLGL